MGRLALAGMAVLAAGGTALALVLNGEGSAAIVLTKVSETNNTITFSYNLISGAVGYRYSSSNMSKFSHTFDPTRSTVKFSKANSYKVEALGVLEDGTYPSDTTTTTTTTTTTPPPAGNVFVTTTGNDSTCVRGDVTKPCLSFDKGYQIAQCGDSVLISAGTYGEQKLRERASCATPITLDAQPGAFAPRLWFGSCGACFASDAPDDLVVRGLRTYGIVMWGDAQNVTLDKIDGGGVFIKGPLNVVVKNSDFGPCASPDTPSHAGSTCLGYGNPGDGSYYQQTRIVPGDDATYVTRNILFESNVFHDHIAGGTIHWECVWTNGGTDVTFRGNWFYDCENTGSLWFDSGSNSGLRGTWVIENNWFGRGEAMSLGFSGTPYPGTVIVRFNSFSPVQSTVVNPNPQDAQGRIKIVGNIIGQWGYSNRGCVGGAVYLYNIFAGGPDQTCGGTGNVWTATSPYVNSSNLGAGNYHLSGAKGSTLADNFVPTSAADSGLAIDRDGDARPIDSARDVGSDER